MVNKFCNFLCKKSKKKNSTVNGINILTKNFNEQQINEEKNSNVVIKSMTNLNVYSDLQIDEEFDVVEMQRGACVEFKKIGDYWYILSSDGLKNS